MSGVHFLIYILCVHSFSVCSIHSWSWPNRCPASLHLSWLLKRPWRATAKSQSLKTIKAIMPVTSKPASIFKGSTYHEHQPARGHVLFFLKGDWMPLQFQRTEAIFILLLCLVPKLHEAIMYFLFVAAIARVCCWHTLLTTTLCITEMRGHCCKGSRVFAHQEPYSQGFYLFTRFPPKKH